MQCSSCNNTIADGSRFCTFCGNAVEASPATNAAPQFETEANEQIILFDDRMRIERKKGLSSGFRGTTEIFFRDISSIEYKDAGRVSLGHILILYRAGSDVKTSVVGNNSIKNEKEVLAFTRKNQTAFDTLRTMLNDVIEQYRNSPQVQMQSVPSNLDELKKLAELRGAEVITSDEAVEALPATNAAPLAPMPNLPPGALWFAKGINGQITLFDDRIRIERKGGLSFLNYGFRGTKEIFIREISAIEYKDAGGVLSGHILFLYRGGRDVKTSVFGDNSIASNENAVMFIIDDQPAFDTLRTMINDRMEQCHKPQQVQIQSAPSNLDELKKLAELRDAGVVTPEEFEREKARLLASH